MLRKLSLPASVRVGGVMKFGGIEAVLQPILSQKPWPLPDSIRETSS